MLAERSFTIYLYMTPFEKFLPECSITVIGPDNVNSGISYVCPEDGEIVIYRREEWFKVFIHETFHALGLDFASMKQDQLNKNIRYLFQLKQKVIYLKRIQSVGLEL